MLLLSDGFLPSFLEELVGRAFAEVGAERHGHCFGVDKAVGKLEVLAHARGVHFEASDGFGGAIEGAGGEANEFGKRFPLGMPVAESAFVLLGHRAQDRGSEKGNALCSREDRSTGYGVAFLWHCRRPASACGGGLRK